MTHDPYLLLLLALLTYRLTRLLTRDELLRPLRERVIEPMEALRHDRWIPQRRGANGILIDGHSVPPTPLGIVAGEVGFLLSCPWCVSVWIAAGTVLSYALWPDFTRTAALIAAAAAVAGLLLDRDRS